MLPCNLTVEKKREKSTLLGVILGASVYRGSPGFIMESQMNIGWHLMHLCHAASFLHLHLSVDTHSVVQVWDWLRKQHGKA